MLAGNGFFYSLVRRHNPTLLLLSQIIMPDALPIEVIDRIAKEEALRLDIRGSLSKNADSAASKGFSAWNWLNSSFFLLLLSTFFVSGIGTFYQHRYEERRDAEKTAETASIAKQKKDEADAIELRKRKEAYSKAALEVSHRYSASLVGLRAVHDRFKNRKNITVQAAIRTALAPLLRPPSAGFLPLYPEYSSFSGLAVVAEMRRHSESGEADKLRTIIADTSNLLNKIAAASLKDRRDAIQVASELVAVMHNPRWDNGFAYTDCKSEKPFC